MQMKDKIGSESSTRLNKRKAASKMDGYTDIAIVEGRCRV